MINRYLREVSALQTNRIYVLRVTVYYILPLSSLAICFFTESENSDIFKALFNISRSQDSNKGSVTTVSEKCRYI